MGKAVNCDQEINTLIPDTIGPPYLRFLTNLRGQLLL